MGLLAVLGPVAGAWAQQSGADFYVAQAILHFEDKQFDEALDNLRRALQLEPDHFEALYYSGLTHLARRQPAEARPFLERARARAPQDPVVAFQLGLALFSLEEYDRAGPLMEEAFRAQPTLDGLGYYVGFLRYRGKNYQGALAAFRAGRASDPEIQQVTRFYTGLALGVLGLPAQAAAQVEEALRAAPGSALTGPAERLRDTIVAARDRQRRFSAELRLGGFYDDNVSVMPSPNTEEPLVGVIRRHNQHESTGELAGARFNYVWYRDQALESSIGYSFFGTYNNELPSLNVTNHLVTLGLTHGTALGSLPAQMSAQYSWDILYLNEEEFVRRHTFTLSGTLAESDQHLTQVFTRYQNKDFAEGRPAPPSREIRDADNVTVGVLHVLRFEQDRHFVKGGYQYDREAADGANYAYDGHRLLAGAQYTLPWWSVRLHYDVDVHLRAYDGRNSILPTTKPERVQRQDRELTNVVRAELPLPYSLTLSGEYQSTLNLSNVAVFDYRRNVFSMILSWSY